MGLFEDEGAEIVIESLPYRRSLMKIPRHMRWGTLRVGSRASSVASMPAQLAPIVPLVPPRPITATRTIRLGTKMTLPGHDWLINGETHHVVGKGRVTIAFRADDRPGPWMYHCHILEHHAAGMMGHFDVVRG